METKQPTFPTIQFLPRLRARAVTLCRCWMIARASPQPKRPCVLRDTGKSHTRQGEMGSCRGEVGKALGNFLWSLCWNIGLIIRANRATYKALNHKFEIPSIITPFIYSNLKLCVVDNAASEGSRSETILCARLCPLMLCIVKVIQLVLFWGDKLRSCKDDSIIWGPRWKSTGSQL
ncbi:hypothetical protein B9Z19DRAFT_737273 [Tuber borchii]|uniref:Uncharacterized protein n=1 Tax=Tuber borchii TaxID=42251 RepID=A0A2T6ZY43_TUBBO|nr:hypothetical protein B9Z19DRAFT_737273 [Tuber borchii]